MATKKEKIQPWQLKVGDKFDFAGSKVTVIHVGDTSLGATIIDVQIKDNFGVMHDLRLYHATPHMLVTMDVEDHRKIN